MIVATAGHIDHGKTSLVRFLTGIETDRLPEERKRGISIDLGFAHADLGDGVDVSFIDVPGHERFVRNMIAGVIGIDAALIVIAADDGLMPQTFEHLRILELLDVRQAAIAMTKIDKVTSQRVDEVVASINQALKGTPFQNPTVFPISTKTGDGIPALKEWLRMHSVHRRTKSDGMYRFRMPVDRAFSMAGSGTVVTGTVHAGKVSVGDRLAISHSGDLVRVRGIQIHGASTESAQSGQRCALNLSGVEVSDIGRGNWVQDPVSKTFSNRLDVKLKVLNEEEKPLSHWSRLHVHLGTAAVVARVVIAAEGCIQPGESMYVQLLTDKPIFALHGDRFIVRDEGGSRTVGGGMVLDPNAPKRSRRATLKIAELQCYERPSPAGILSGLIDLSDTGVNLSLFSQSMNLTERGLNRILKEVDMVVLGKTNSIGINRGLYDGMVVKLLDQLKRFHLSNPKEDGASIASMHKEVANRFPKDAFQSFVRDMANRQLVVLSNDKVRLKEHVSSANAEDESLWEKVYQTLTSAGVQTPLIADLAKTINVKEQFLRDFLYRKSRTGEVRRITDERFCLKETLSGLSAVIKNVATQSLDGFFTAAEFRDAIGTGRGLAIHYLEYFDQIGVTQRFGNRRKVGKDFV